MKKLLVFVTALLVCLSVTSCKENNTQPVPDDSTDSGVTQVTVDTDSMKKKAVEALNSIPSVDLGDNFTIASTSGMVHVPTASDSNRNSILKLHNALFEKKYSTRLVQFEDNSDTVLRSAQVNMLAGVHYADLLSIPQKDLGSFAARGVLLKTQSVIGGDFNKAWYDTVMMSQAARGSESYGIYGEFNRDIRSYYCLYVNRDLLRSAGLSMPYDKVKEGSWTWDELIAMLRINTDINANAGLAASDLGLLTRTVYKSGGGSFTDTGYAKTPALAYNNERTAGIISLLRSIGGQKTLYNDSAESGSARGDFMQGNALFYIGTVGEMEIITTMSPDWCILPLPKTVASNDTYYSYVSPDHAVITVYAGSTCKDMAAALDGLYAAAMGGYLSDAYYYELIDTSIRDSSALDMMDYICGIKDGRPINDLTDVYPDYRVYTVDALAKAVYNYELTPESIYNGAKDSFEAAQ
ncbi:MAG: extracellular solute-binding protein [Clostridia bacterium]|nr:extracellular solute-binding protein [Clostridia bacterium]